MLNPDTSNYPRIYISVSIGNDNYPKFVRTCRKLKNPDILAVLVQGNVWEVAMKVFEVDRNATHYRDIDRPEAPSGTS